MSSFYFASSSPKGHRIKGTSEEPLKRSIASKGEIYVQSSFQFSRSLKKSPPTFQINEPLVYSINCVVFPCSFCTNLSSTKRV